MNALNEARNALSALLRDLPTVDGYGAQIERVRTALDQAQRETMRLSTALDTATRERDDLSRREIRQREHLAALQGEEPEVPIRLRLVVDSESPANSGPRFRILVTTVDDLVIGWLAIERYRIDQDAESGLAHLELRTFDFDARVASMGSQERLDHVLAGREIGQDQGA